MVDVYLEVGAMYVDIDISLYHVYIDLLDAACMQNRLSRDEPLKGSDRPDRQRENERERE